MTNIFINLNWIGIGIIKLSVLTLIKLVFIFIFIIIFLYLLYIEHYEDPRICLFSNNVEDNYLKAGFVTEVKKVGSIIVGTLALFSSVATLHTYVKDNSLRVREQNVEVKESNLNQAMKKLQEDFDKQDFNEKIANKPYLDKTIKANDVMQEGYSKQKELNEALKLLEEMNKDKDSPSISQYQKQIFLKKIERQEELVAQKKSELITVTDELKKIQIDWAKSVEKNIDNINMKDGNKELAKESSEGIDKGTSGSGSVPILSPDEDEILKVPLSLIQNIFIGLLFLNSIIFSCIVSIIFSLFGDYLMDKYDLNNRLPRFAKFLSLRRKFQSYYLKLNIILIIVLVIIQIIVCFSVIMI